MSGLRLVKYRCPFPWGTLELSSLGVCITSTPRQCFILVKLSRSDGGAVPLPSLPDKPSQLKSYQINVAYFVCSINYSYTDDFMSSLNLRDSELGVGSESWLPFSILLLAVTL